LFGISPPRGIHHQKTGPIDRDWLRVSCQGRGLALDLALWDDDGGGYK
jgi:hypothetical protein